MTNIAALPEHDRYVATLAERAEQRLQAERQAAEPTPTAEQLIDRYGPALVLEAAAMIAELAQAGSDIGGGGGGEEARAPMIQVTNLDSDGAHEYEVPAPEPVRYPEPEPVRYAEQPAGDTLGEARVLDRYAAVYPTREDG